MQEKKAKKNKNKIRTKAKLKRKSLWLTQTEGHSQIKPNQPRDFGVRRSQGKPKTIRAR